MEYLQSYYKISPFFFVITASASLLFFVSNLTLIFGGGDLADDLPIGENHLASDASFKFFSTQTILAFFMGLGWAGITSTVKWNLPLSIALLIGGVFGLILMTFTSFLLNRVHKLNHTPERTIYASLGSKGMVYSEIPKKEQGAGQVQVVIHGQQKIVKAESSGEKIRSFSEVEIVGIKDKNTIIVKPINGDAND